MLLARAGLSPALDTLRENKRIEHRVNNLREANAMLNGKLNRRSNNSFDASGISVPLIDNLNQFADTSRRVNSGVRHLLKGQLKVNENEKVRRQALLSDLKAKERAEIVFAFF